LIHLWALKEVAAYSDLFCRMSGGVCEITTDE
jgi:hypothetical protein